MGRYDDEDTLRQILTCLQQLNIHIEITNGKLDELLEQVRYTNYLLAPNQGYVAGQRK